MNFEIFVLGVIADNAQCCKKPNTLCERKDLIATVLKGVKIKQQVLKLNYLTIAVKFTTLYVPIKTN